MNNPAKIYGWVAAGLTLVWFLVHTFVGGAEVAGPLRASDLPISVMAPAWMVWHMVTVVLLFTALLFAVATWRGDRSSMAAGAVLSLCLAVAGLAAAPLTGAGLMQLPQGTLFVVSGGLGAMAWLRMRA